mgnify:CR=1 FL=1
MSTVVPTSYDRLRMPELFLAWLAGDPALAPHLPRPPHHPQGLWEAARDRRDDPGPEVWRSLIQPVLAAYAEEHGAPEAVHEAASQFAKEGTLAIVTGQQPGLFGGPLYVWHKVATALRLAESLRALPSMPPIVTVFWNHSEDHDWGEANHGWLLNSGLDAQRIRLGMSAHGLPLAEIPAGEAIERALLEARDLLPENDFRNYELSAMAPVNGAETLGSHLSRQLFRHFGDQGLLILEPARLPEACREPLEGFRQRGDELRSAFHSELEELQGRGFDGTVDPQSPMLFELGGGRRREPLPDGETPHPDRRLSPGVLLRSVWQDVLLPTLATVVGPGEASYLAMTREIYSVLGVPRPPIMPRASITHVERRLWEDLERWNLGLGMLAEGPVILEERISEAEGASLEDTPEGALPEEVMRRLADDLKQGMRALEAGVAEVDRNLLLPMARVTSRASSELRKLSDKVAKQRRNQAGTWRQHARRLCGELSPRGRLQERVFPALFFLARHGETFPRSLLAAADPFARDHLLSPLGMESRD